MQQSRIMSLVEAVTSVLVGFAFAVGAQLAVFPWFGVRLSLGDNLTIGGVFTAVSILRSYGLRRLFETVRTRIGPTDGSHDTSR